MRGRKISSKRVIQKKPNYGKKMRVTRLSAKGNIGGRGSLGSRRYAMTYQADAENSHPLNDQKEEEKKSAWGKITDLHVSTKAQFAKNYSDRRKRQT